MTALLNERMRAYEKWTYHLFTLTSGTKAWKGGLAALNTATGKVVPATGTGTLIVIGTFAETVDAAGGDQQVNVDLWDEITVEWLANDANSITAAMLGKVAYVVDDQTVAATGTVVAGRIWAVDPLLGAAIQKVSLAPPTTPPAAAEAEEPEPEPEPEPELEEEV